jgi:hypothetical protein
MINMDGINDIWQRLAWLTIFTSICIDSPCSSLSNSMRESLLRARDFEIFGCIVGWDGKQTMWIRRSGRARSVQKSFELDTGRVGTVRTTGNTFCEQLHPPFERSGTMTLIELGF